MPEATMPESTTVPVEEIVVGDTIIKYGEGAYREVEVLRIESGIETVLPLLGCPCIRLWCRCESLDREGYVTFGPGGVAQRAA